VYRAARVPLSLVRNVYYPDRQTSQLMRRASPLIAGTLWLQSLAIGLPESAGRNFLRLFADGLFWLVSRVVFFLRGHHGPRIGARLVGARKNGDSRLTRDIPAA